MTLYNTEHGIYSQLDLRKHIEIESRTKNFKITYDMVEQYIERVKYFWYYSVYMSIDCIISNLENSGPTLDPIVPSFR